MKSITQQIVELIKESEEKKVAEAYEKGFEAGKLHRELNGPSIKVVSKPVETDQQKRDRIVKQAKEFVEKFTNSNFFEFSTEKFPLGWWAREGDSSPATCKLDFIVNKEKRTVVCLIKNPSRNMGIRSKGFAKCAPNDCFNRHIGEFIALHRALGLEVQQEYLDVPNPTKVRVGDVVKSNTTVFDQTPYKVVKLDDGKAYDVEGWIYISYLDIIDDSESEPNV